MQSPKKSTRVVMVKECSRSVNVAIGYPDIKFVRLGEVRSRWRGGMASENVSPAASAAEPISASDFCMRTARNLRDAICALPPAQRS